MPLSPDDRRVLADRRARVMAAMGDGVLLVAAAPEKVRSGDVEYPYRQNSDFDYLTGLGEPDAVAVLAPGARRSLRPLRPPARSRARDLGREIGRAHV